MSKKIKVIISSVTMLVIVLILTIPVLAQSKADSLMSAWGNILKGYAQSKKTQENDIYMQKEFLQQLQRKKYSRQLTSIYCPVI